MALGGRGVLAVAAPTSSSNTSSSSSNTSSSSYNTSLYEKVDEIDNDIINNVVLI
ncbi:hypothetical protein ACTXT7_006631 [Hymenolepis weldensis]